MSEKAGLDLLRQPFPPNAVNKLPKPYKANAEKGNCQECGGYHGLPALHLDFVGHAALTARLLDADPEWSWEPFALDTDGLPKLDGMGGLWIRLTVCGVTRIGYGDAQGKTGPNAIKEVIGDALRNAGMRFGAALDLWHKGDLHGQDESAPEQPPIEQVARETALQRSIREAAAKLGINTWTDVAADFTTRNPGLTMRDAGEEALLQFLADLKDAREAVEAAGRLAAAGQLSPA